jgi:TolA-binding protein
MVGSASAQDYTSMGISSVVSAADSMLKQGNYAGAIPALEEVIRRTVELTSTQGRETLQDSRFQLARAYFQNGNTSAGMGILEEYIANEPRNQERLALRMMAQGYFERQKWDEVAKIARRILGMSNLSKDDKFNANLLLGQALFRQEEWEACIAPLSFTVSNSPSEKTRQLTQIMVIRALVESKHWSDLFGRLPRLYRTDAKYDITLNLTLMNAGKALFESGKPDDYLNALHLYRMVLPREKLIGFAEKQVEGLSRTLEKKVKYGIAEADRIDLQEEIDRINESVKVLSDLPPYEDEVTFRVGQIYAEVKRYWEGYVLFDSLYRKTPDSEIGEAAILQSVLILYDIKETDRAEKRVVAYLDEKPNGQYARTLLLLVLRDNLKKQNADRVVSFRGYMDAMPSSSDPDEQAIEADIRYMMAFGYFQKKDFATAGELFGQIIDHYPNSPSRGDSTYFRGMTYMMLGDYQNAIDDFLLYQKENDGAEFYPPSMFRQAVCLYGLEKVGESEAIFDKFIESYPDSDLVSEAYSMRGDIEAAKDGRDDPKTPDIDEYDPHTLDRALSDYRKAIDKAVLPQQASYAAFQAAKVYKLEFKWQEIIDLMNYYMDLLGEKSDVAQSVYWIGQSQIELGQVDEAVAAYLDAIERFGNDVSQVGIDKIVRELINIAGQYLSEEDRQGLAVKLKLMLTEIEPDQDVLRLRLSVLTASLMGEKVVAQLGKGLLLKGQNLAETSPITLALMCDAAVRIGDTNQMARLYDYFHENFEESDEIWHAYRAKIHQLLAGKEYKEALKYIEDVQGLFGVDSFMDWAQLIKADTLYHLGMYKEAEDAYNTVMGVAEWRGVAFAKAMLGMGRCRMAEQDYKTAHSFFQRTYLMFKGYDNGKWAADAYLEAANCLAKLGRNADVVKTLNSMLEDSYVNTLPQAEIARKMKKKYEGAL